MRLEQVDPVLHQGIGIMSLSWSRERIDPMVGAELSGPEPHMRVGWVELQELRRPSPVLIATNIINAL